MAWEELIPSEFFCLGGAIDFRLADGDIMLVAGANRSVPA